MSAEELIVVVDGTPMIRDTPIRVRDVVVLWRSGVDLVDIPSHLPDVSVVAASSALRYYGEHMAESESPGL
jgi:uncharacterized protein (DUF433 family)